MGYLLKEDDAKQIRQKYKTSYISEELGVSQTYISLVLHRKKTIPKHMAYCFSKVIDNNLEVNDLFELVEKEK